MNIKDFFSGKWFVKQVSVPFVSYFQQRFQGLLGSAKERKYLEEYRNWVFACIQARAEEVGNINLRLLRQTKNGDEEVFDHEALALLFQVNPTMTKADLFMGTQAYLDLDGNAFWFLARDNKGKGKIKEIWLLRPDKVSIQTSKENPLTVEGYIYHQPDGKKVPFEPNQILHFKNFNPRADLPFPHRGLSIVEAASWSIDTDNEARQWNFSFFKNSARPDGVLVKKTPGALSEPEYKRVRKMWEQEHQGSQNAYRPAILSGGIEWQEVQKSQKDMDFVEQRRFSRDEILALFRVPKTAIGIVEDVNRANAEATNFIFALRTIKPLMQKIVDTINEFLIPEFGEDLFLDYDSPVPEDRAQIVSEYLNGIDKWLTRNDIRRKEGLPPSRDGDRIFGTLATIPIDVVEEETKQISEVSVKKSKFYRPKKKDSAQKIIEEFVSKLPVEEIKEKRELSELAVKNYIEIWKKAFDVETEPLRKKIDKFLSDQEKEVLENIKEELKGLEVKEYQFKQISDLIFNRRKAVEAGIALITPEIKRYIKQSGGQAILLTGAAEVFNDESPAVLDFIEERAELFSKTFNETTAEKLLTQLREGIGKNETQAQLSERISGFYEGERDFRSDRAARTEVAASSNFGAVEAYEQAGVIKHKWIVVSPEDADCVGNQGEEVEIGEEFNSGHTEPPAHPNCVCTTIPVFE